MERLFEYEIKDEKVCITKYIGSSKEVVIPEEIEGLPVTSIGDYAFYYNNLSSLRLTRGTTRTSVDLTNIKSIGNCAFSYNNLTSVDLSGVKSIGYAAFSKNKLTNINLSNVKSIGSYAFYNNNLEAIILPEKFRERSKDIFDFDEEELDNRNRKYVKKYVEKMCELYMKKLYKNSRKYRLIFEYITYYTYRESYNVMLEEVVALN